MYSGVLTNQSSGAGVESAFVEKKLREVQSKESPGIERNRTTVIQIADATLDQILANNRLDLKILASQYFLQHVNRIVRDQLFQQVDWLIDPNDWAEGDQLANHESFKTLLKLILNATPKESPYLSLSDEGNLVTTWIASKHRMHVECFPGERYRWFIATGEGDEAEKTSGTTKTLKRFLELLAPYRSVGWF